MTITGRTMAYKTRLMLYYASVSAVGLSLAGSVLAVIMLLITPEEWHGWLITLATCLLVFFIFAAFYLLRKSKFPAAGKDYH